jgi:hypothetical protein
MDEKWFVILLFILALGAFGIGLHYINIWLNKKD